MRTRTHNLYAHYSQSRFRVISILFLTIYLCGCSFPSNQSLKTSVSYDDTGNYATTPVKVQFDLSLSQPLVKDERIVIEFLDEVTGLPYNKQVHELRKVNDLEYSVTIAIPVGSVIKYRYAKIGETYTVESAQIGASVRYRLYFVEHADEIKDLLFSWGESSSNGKYGRLAGIVLDRETKAPISDILVSAGGQLTFSDMNGRFYIDGLVEGTHNVVFYAIDGHYRTYQQGATIASGSITQANLSLIPMPLVKVRFRVTPPTEAQGAPIYLAGNLIQFGNTFSVLNSGLSINPKGQPVLTPQDDGTLTLDLQVYVGADLRYKFTLGDGYWNAEQSPSGGFQVRQLVVPNESITLNQKISSWRTTNLEPITFKIFMPPDRSPKDEKFIQFKAQEWMEPIPLWPLGDGNFLYILYSPLSKSSPINFRFCRNADCQYANNSETDAILTVVQPKEEPQTINITVEEWKNWQSSTKTEFKSIPSPVFSGQYATIIELSPAMDPYWDAYLPLGLSTIAQMGAKTVIFAPQWYLTDDSLLLQPKLGVTPFSNQLIHWLNETQEAGLTPGLFPQIFPSNAIPSWWTLGSHTDSWWDAWFDIYSQFIINYAKIAEQTESEMLIIGGKAALPTFSGGINPDGSDSDIPERSAQIWYDLIKDIRNIYHGDLVWATNAHEIMDPLPEFTYTFDGIYVTIDSPIAIDTNPSFNEIAYGFTSIVDNLIYEVYRSTGKPLTIALAYPAMDGAAQGRALLGDPCYNDGLFLHDEVDGFALDLGEQALVYEAVLPIVASRPWISGTSIRGYEPTGIIHDQTSSIAGKPASEIIVDWFQRINSE